MFASVHTNTKRWENIIVHIFIDLTDGGSYSNTFKNKVEKKGFCLKIVRHSHFRDVIKRENASVLQIRSLLRIRSKRKDFA